MCDQKFAVIDNYNTSDNTEPKLACPAAGFVLSVSTV